MFPTSSKQQSQPTGGIKNGYDSSSIPSKESNSSRNSLYYRVELVFIKLLKSGKLVTQKKESVTTDLDNVNEHFYYDSPSPGIAWDSDPNAPDNTAEHEVVEIKATGLEAAESQATELKSSILDQSPRISTRPGGRSGAGGRPHNDRASGRANHPPNQTTPSYSNSGRQTTASQPAQGYVASSSYHDPSFPSTTERAVFQYNVAENHEPQIIGADIAPSYNGPDDLRPETANFIAQDNVHSGTGSQIIGQYVRHGARPRWFAGQYTNNRNTTGGEQIIGVKLQ